MVVTSYKASAAVSDSMSNQIEQQETLDRTPALMATPKPPRPDKSTILSSESAAINMVRSNRAEKERQDHQV